MRKQKSRRYFSGIHNYESVTGLPYGSGRFQSDPVLYQDNNRLSSQFKIYSDDESLNDPNEQ